MYELMFRNGRDRSSVLLVGVSIPSNLDRSDDRHDVTADSKDILGRSPLSHAAEIGDEVAVRLLVDRDDVDADSHDHDGWTTLGHGGHFGHEAIVRLLFERGCSKDDFARIPSEHTTKRRTYNRVKAFIKLCLTEQELRI
jgi:ankyrin repeat protein